MNALHHSVAEESALVGRMLAGEQRAFDAFFKAHFGRLYRFVMPRVGSDSEVAREVVLATLCKAMRKLASFRGEAAVFTWLCQICRRQIVDHLRAQRRYSQHVVLIDDQSDVRAAIESLENSADSDLCKAYGRVEVGRLLRAVLDRLPVQYGDALEWKYVEGYSVEEIAARLGIGHTAAQSMLARARIAFRDSMLQVCGPTAADLAASLEA